MRETRNFVLVVLLFAFFAWGFWAWLMLRADPMPASTVWLHRGLSVGLFLLSGACLSWGLWFEDKLPDDLARLTGGIYYEHNGLCFVPVMRKEGEQAYINIFFENRFENDCNAIVHLRPPPESIQHRPDANDIHFAFAVPGGAVGVIRQPVAVHPRLQGSVIDVQLAAAVNYPHSQGEQLRSHQGLPCGTFRVDWGESFRTGSHELSGEIELINPITVHMPIPMDVTNRIRRGQQWKQEIFSRYEK
jgi:hypothetical protein